MNAGWTISVVDAFKIRGKPAGWFPSTAKLIESGVPPAVATRWASVRRDMTVGLKRRVKQDRN